MYVSSKALGVLVREEIPVVESDLRRTLTVRRPFGALGPFGAVCCRAITPGFDA